MLHHRNGLLCGPVKEVSGRSVTDIPVVPTGGPNHMELAVAAPNNAGISHQLILANCGCKYRLVIMKRGPNISIPTAGKMQSILASIFKISEKINDPLCLHFSEDHKCSKECNPLHKPLRVNVPVCTWRRS